jgi:hypothetical protein
VKAPILGPGTLSDELHCGATETFPNLAGRQAHIDGGGGDIFRDVERMNAILAHRAHVCPARTPSGKPPLSTLSQRSVMSGSSDLTLDATITSR